MEIHEVIEKALTGEKTEYQFARVEENGIVEETITFDRESAVEFIRAEYHGSLNGLFDQYGTMEEV